MKRGMKSGMRSGSLTVEAALVFGVLFMVMLTVFYMAFYLHDRAVLYETAAYYAEAMAHMAEEPVNLSGEMEARRLEEQNIFRTNGYGGRQSTYAIEAAFMDEANSGMLMSSVTSARAVFNGRSLSLSYSAEFRVLQGSFIETMTGIARTWSGKEERTLYMDPEEFVRLCRGLIWRKKE